MRKLNYPVLACLLLVLCSSIYDHTVNLQLDASASTLKWTGYAELGGFAPQGAINPVSGTVVYDHGKITSASFVVDMSSISYSDENLQEHLKEEDFFYVEKFPQASFQSTEIEGTKATGNLTIRGVTKPITFDIQSKVVDRSLAVSGKMVVDRTAYEIKYNSKDFFQDLGSHAIKNEFDLEFDLVFK